MMVYNKVFSELDSLQYVDKLYVSDTDSVSLSQGV